FHLRNISKLRAVVSQPELEMLIHAFISSRIDYCNSLFSSLNKSVLHRLQSIKNVAARLLTRSNHIPLLCSVQWLLVLHTPSRSLRSVNQNLLSMPRTHLKTCGDRAFEAMAPRLCNALPISIRFAENVDCFKGQVKTNLFRLAFG
uniref:Uncharacterized protein n=1 Tax=Gasterosteus aculeatus TaxID=69293 RepID=G3N681_GASAC